MTKYEARINQHTFFTVVVQVDHDGEERVVAGFGKHYASVKSAKLGAAKFISKLNNLFKYN
jgi:hypothetical protein|tara:strand:- start:93 stop:275 length:183 start_codon:yes stop_codon:yes gene_type:complete